MSPANALLSVYTHAYRHTHAGCAQDCTALDGIRVSDLALCPTQNCYRNNDRTKGLSVLGAAQGAPKWPI